MPKAEHINEYTIDDLVRSVEGRVMRRGRPAVSDLLIAHDILSAYIVEPSDTQILGRSLYMQMAMDIAEPFCPWGCETPAISREDSDRDALVLLRADSTECGDALRQAFDTARKVYAVDDSFRVVILAETILARAALASYKLQPGDMRLDGSVLKEGDNGHTAFLSDILDAHRILCEMNEIARGERTGPILGKDRMRHMQETRNAFRFLADHICDFASWSPLLTEAHCVDDKAEPANHGLPLKGGRESVLA